MSCIHFVGGEKGGVGKSVTARVLAQYFINHHQTFVGFDADQSHATFSRFYSQFCKPLVLDQFESTDQIIEEALENDVQLIVDLPAQSERFLMTWMEANDVLGLAEESDLQIVYWYVVDDGKDSAALLEKMVEQYGLALTVIVVKNLGRGDNFDAVEALAAMNDELAPVLSMALPALYPNTMQKIDQHDLDFWAAAALKDAGLGLMERQRAKTWLKHAHAEVERVLAEI